MLDPHTLKAAIRKVKDFQYTETEIKVREATNNDPWGTKSSLMQEIADATHNYEEYPRLFAMLWKRLTDINHVMHVQKALILIEYLLRNGADRFIRDAKQRSRDIQRLRKYRHYDSENVDDAKDARIKAKRVFELLTNDKLLQEERSKAEKLKGMKITMGYGADGGTGGTGGGTYTSTPTIPPTGPGYAEPDRYASFTPADMGVGGRGGDEDGEKPKGKAPDFDGGDDDEDGDPFKEADDPFGPPPEMTPGADGSSRPKKDKAAKETVAPREVEKPATDKVKKKKKKEKEAGGKARPRAPSGDAEPEPAKPKPAKAAQSADPFGDEDEDEPRAAPAYAAAAAPKQKSKSTIAAAFDDEPAGTGEVDLLTSPDDGVRSLSLETKSRPDPIWDFTEAPKEKPKSGGGAKSSDDPWDALTDVGSLGGKPTPKKEPIASGRTMASMRGTQIDVSRDVFADFSAPPTQGAGRGLPVGAVPVYGGATPVFYQQGGYAPGPAVYTSSGYASAPVYAPTAAVAPSSGYYSPPAGAGSPAYMDPFASMASAAPPPASRQTKPTSSTAFDGLSW